ncbi:MAG: thioredoxin family protein [Oligoflexus sp.]|nr:thioredoxin family protein [Pseudopedobacter sp.]
MNYDPQLIQNGFTYLEYRNYIDFKLSEHKTTENNVESELINYTRLNVQRMKRLDKTAQISNEIINKLKQIKQFYTFLIITEGWCGDASQTTPVINKIAELSDGKISVRFILRDQNLDIMDQHLTNGSRAIPIVIVLDQDLIEVASWGSRPKDLKILVTDWVKDIQMTKEDRIEKVHAWYAKDKTQATQKDFLEILNTLN